MTEEEITKGVTNRRSSKKFLKLGYYVFCVILLLETGLITLLVEGGLETAIALFVSWGFSIFVLLYLYDSMWWKINKQVKKDLIEYKEAVRNYNV